jgi:hypothetical protein
MRIVHNDLDSEGLMGSKTRRETGNESDHPLLDVIPAAAA